MGERFAGRYELLDPLGEGGMASVWRAWDEREGRVVAAKVLRQSDSLALLRFVREQAVRVTGPHVLTPLGWAGEDDRVLFTMPIVDGGSVATLVGDHGPLPPGLVTELMRQLLDGLATVHEARIVHRDVKPANLLLCATGRERPHLLLSDFGIAVGLEQPRFTEAGGVVGTPGFVAPEVLSGAELRPTADLYAAGQVGLLMLGGAPGPSDPPGRPGGPDHHPLTSLLAQLTDPDPDRRPASARAALVRLGPAPEPWDPDTLGEVDVFAHVGPDPGGRPQLLARPPASRPPEQGRPAPTRDLPVSTDLKRSSSPAARRGLSLLAVGVAVLAALGLGALLMAWSPWAAGGPPAPPGTPASTGSTTPASGTVTTSATPAPPAGSGPSAPPASSGTVSVGTVVSKVGQSCSFSDVGGQERTVAGDPVVCQRRADGSYAWDPPPG